jgi:hypothetical protein
MLSGEASNTNFYSFGFTRLGFEPIIYRTGGDYVNHYTIDAVNHHSITELLLTVASNTNKTDNHGITDLLWTVVLNTNKTDHHSI